MLDSVFKIISRSSSPFISQEKHLGKFIMVNVLLGQKWVKNCVTALMKAVH